MTAATARSRLVALPKELIFQIIGKLDLAALLRLSAACKSLYHLVSSSALIQYQIELERAGYVNGPASGPLTIVQRRALLRDYRRSGTGYPGQGAKTSILTLAL
ncbi:hypothetical protein BOTBODRAFT_179067 [Botryobasidium botryosum FD-172 SS1]|uniref:F-box domain-containing protein n=1 Tax=Botryobasidium botryosum (strain FD-172 SS1) TaxID=930990 RepID=A0A067M3V5_BOTB1|nr:hypothetical protein BOTBODRAFT_179067 [Botryobasidium botryosum FD-172 SS1]